MEGRNTRERKEYTKQKEMAKGGKRESTREKEHLSIAKGKEGKYSEEKGME